MRTMAFLRGFAFAFALSATALPRIVFASCGNGILESPAEECDDGNVSAGDCCAADCQFEDAFAPCVWDDFCTSALNSICDGFGVCGVSIPQCDGKGGGDLLDPGPTDAQRVEMRAAARLYTSYDVADLGDPSTGTQYALCIFNSRPPWYYVGGVDYELLLPTGAGWQQAANGFRYRRPEGDTSALSRARLRLKLGQQKPTTDIYSARVRVVADGAALGLPGPVDATRYFDTPFYSTIVLVNELGTCVGINSAPGRYNRGLLNTPEHVHWSIPRLGD